MNSPWIPINYQNCHFRTPPPRRSAAAPLMLRAPGHGAVHRGLWEEEHVPGAWTWRPPGGWGMVNTWGKKWWKHQKKWGKMVNTPKSSFLMGFSLMNQLFLGVTGVGFYVPMFHITELGSGYHFQQIFVLVMWNKSSNGDIYQPLENIGKMKKHMVKHMEKRYMEKKHKHVSKSE